LPRQRRLQARAEDEELGVADGFVDRENWRPLSERAT
jgi:hypothetical protein